MPASDYKQICLDNIRRRGDEFDDIGRLISEQLYSDRSHFVFELLQNAEDALERRFRLHSNKNTCRKVRFRLFQNRLEFSHFGVLFNEKDVRGISDVLNGTKSQDNAQIGKFGIGFKSVYAFTASPEIHSGEEHFVIRRYIRTEEKKPRPDLSIAQGETIFIFPFDHKNLSANQAFDMISHKLRGLGSRVLLFLKWIDEIEWFIETNEEKGQYLKENKQVETIGNAFRITVIGTKNNQDDEENWLIFERPVTISDREGSDIIKLGFRIEISSTDKTESIKRENNTPLVVYFPTEEATGLGFLIQGPYSTTSARNIIHKDVDLNKKLIEETAELVVETLMQLKLMDLLSVSLLKSLPIRRQDFPEGNMFNPIFNRVKEILMSEKLLPTDDHTFTAGCNAKLARGAGLRELLKQDQLRVLFQFDNEINWLTEEITHDRTPDLYDYLKNELGVDEISPEKFANKLSEKFLAEQTDEWFIKFYKFLSEHKSLWNRTYSTLRHKPILRLEDGSHVEPFRDYVQPNAYITDVEDVETSLKIIKKALSQDKDVHTFLRELGIPELDVVEEVIENILPEYMSDSPPSIEIHRGHILKIEHAYRLAPIEKKNRLCKKLRETSFILTKRQKSTDVIYCKPAQVYFETDELNLYFGEMDSCVFVDSEYTEPAMELFGTLGVKNSVRIRRNEKNQEGHVIIWAFHGNHKRGLNGFDPDITVDGLQFAMTCPTPEKSRFIWNRIAAPHYDCICGTVEESTRQTYKGSKKTENQKSEFGKLLTETIWLPDSSGNMHKSSDLALDDLPESFVRCEKLADKLGMKKDIVAKLAEEAGISEEALDRARQFENSPLEVRQQIDVLLGQQKMSHENQKGDPYHVVLCQAFSASGSSLPPSDRGSGGTTQNISRRREKSQEIFATEIEDEGKLGQRFSFVLRKKWEGKDDQIRVSLIEWYDGRCQICEKTFTQTNGQPYFECLYLVSYKTARWLDREGNVLCLCAEHSAMFQFGPKEFDEDIIQQILRLKVQAEGGDGHPVIQMKLCGEPIEIEYAEKHLIDLQEMIKKSRELEY